MPRSAPSPRKAKSAPSPRKAKSAPSPRKAKSAPLPRKAKLTPLPSKPKTAPSPSKPIMPRKTSPPKISNIPDEIRLKVLSYALNSDGNIILNNDFIKSYFQSMSNIFAINKSYKATIPYITPSLKKIRIINLQKLTITKEILGILKMVDSRKITTLVLRGITFDNKKLFDDFLEFFSNNTNIRTLVLDGFNAEVYKLLEIVETFKELVYLEIKNCKLSWQSFYPFIKAVCLKSLDYLSFTNNTVEYQYHAHLFTTNDSNVIDINGTSYYFYARNFYNRWEIIIKREDNNAIQNNFQVNIVNNRVDGYTYTNTYRNKLPYTFVE